MKILPRYLQVLYPFQSHFLEVPLGRLHYVDEGQGDPVVLLHGNPTWSFYYRNLIIDLSRTHRCIALDHMGCGLSDKPHAFRYRLENHIENVCRLIESLGLQRFSLVLHDWGGAIGLGVFQRLKDRVSKIALLNTAVFQVEDLPLSIRMCRNALWGKLLTQGFNAFLQGSLFTCSINGLSCEVADGYRFPYKKSADRYAIYRFVRDIPLYPRHPSFKILRQIQAVLPELSAIPCHAFWGMQDFVFTPAYLSRWQSYIPDLQVTRYPQAGHWLLEDDDDGQVVNDIHTFLKKAAE